MAEAAAAYIAEAFVIELATAQAIVTTIQVVAAVYTVRENQQRQQRAARARQQESQRDRYTMVRSTTEPRALVLGRQRVSGPLAYIGSYGPSRKNLVYAVIVAAHEIDGFEEIYFDDEIVQLDGSGNVMAVSRRDLFTLTTTGSTFTLTSVPAAGSVVATVAYGNTTVTLGTSVSGSDVTVTGGTAGQTGTVTITYRPKDSPFIAVSTPVAQASITLDAGGNGSVTLPFTPLAGTVKVTGTVGVGIDIEERDITSFSSVSGAVVTVTGWTGGASTWTVTYQHEVSSSRARVRTYTGAPGQAADAGMIAALPGVWTSAHTMTGLAYIVIEADYDPNAFPDGLMNVSARVRGAKLFDPRTGRTEWINSAAPTTGPHPGENPALQIRHVTLSPLIGRMDPGVINDLNIAAEANICDTPTNYVVDGRTYTRPLYTAGLVVRSGTRAKDAIDDLATAMAGRWVFIDGQLRLRAGAFNTPLQTLDETWLTNAQPVKYQARNSRSDVFNVVTGLFIDEQRDYRQLPYPDVESATFIAEDGQDLDHDLPLNAVTFTGQAQQVAAALMREARYGERLTVACNMRADAVEVFDVLYVNLPRWGMDGETFEVMDVGMSLDGGILLSLKRTGPEVWALGATFPGSLLSPNTRFVSPFVVPEVQGLALASGTAQLLRQQDGTVQTRIRVTFTAPTDALVVESGGTEIRYGAPSQPESQWQSVFAEHAQNAAWLAPVQDNGLYLVMARHFNSLVDGRWSQPLLHQVTGKTAAAGDVQGFAGSVTKGRIAWVWYPAVESDYGVTEVRSSNANWGSTTVQPLFRGKASGWQEIVTAAGTFTRYARHFDASGNPSGASATAAVVVAAGDLVQDGSSAQLLVLMPTAQAFTFGPTGAAVPSSQTISFTAQLSNLSGTAAFTCTRYDAAGGSLGTVTMGGSGNTRTLTDVQFGAAAYAVVQASLSTFSDQARVVRLRDGENAVTGLLTNEAHTVATAADGSGGDYSAAGGTFKVFNGIVDVTALSAFSVVSSTGITGMTINAITGVYSLTGTSADSGTAVLRAIYGGVTIDRIYSISRSKTGANGSNGSSVIRVSIFRSIDGTVTAPTGGSYNFATGVLTPPTDWAIDRSVATAGEILYESQQTFSGAAGSTVAGGAWSTPVALTPLGPVIPAPTINHFAVRVGGTSTGGVTIRNNGRIARRVSGSSSSKVDVSKWFLPSGGTPGNSYWVRFTQQSFTVGSGSPSLIGAGGTLQALTSDREVTLECPVTSSAMAVVRYQIYSDALGENLVTSGLIDLEGQAEP